jgi:hypothetical protein
MITFSIRDIKPEEKQQVALRAPSLYKRIENFVMLTMGVIAVLLVPLLIFDHFKPISSGTQAVSCIVFVIAGLSISFWITSRGLNDKGRMKDKDPGRVEVIRVQTTRAIKREDPEDFGIAFYIDVTDKGQQKALYLWGQYLDVLEYDSGFPNTEFEITRLPGHDEFIDFKVSGKYFKEEKTLPAFRKEQWEKGDYPINGQLLNLNIDSISE